jgi:hypothetical protein
MATMLSLVDRVDENPEVSLVRAEGRVSAAKHPFMFYMYTADLSAFRQHLVEPDEVSEIQYPDHGPSGEIDLADPDGYRFGVMHWGEQEHRDWLKRIGRD